jgi:hypothetical protein
MDPYPSYKFTNSFKDAKTNDSYEEQMVTDKVDTSFSL